MLDLVPHKHDQNRTHNRDRKYHNKIQEGGIDNAGFPVFFCRSFFHVRVIRNVQQQTLARPERLRANVIHAFGNIQAIQIDAAVKCSCANRFKRFGALILQQTGRLSVKVQT